MTLKEQLEQKRAELKALEDEYLREEFKQIVAGLEEGHYYELYNPIPTYKTYFKFQPETVQVENESIFFKDALQVEVGKSYTRIAISQCTSMPLSNFWQLKELNQSLCTEISKERFEEVKKELIKQIEELNE